MSEMKIIDAHMHFSNIKSFKQCAQDISKVDYSSGGLRIEYQRVGVIAGVGMGVIEGNPWKFPDAMVENPMLLDLEEALPQFLYYCIGINPEKLSNENNLFAIEREIQNAKAVGFKIYAGYYYHYVYDRIYEPIYLLAAKYNVPVVIHCGETYSNKGLLKYSHPLAVDEVAVRYPNINFVIAHLGYPWCMDVSAMIAKNENVYGDLSGLLVGDVDYVNRYGDNQAYIDYIRNPIDFSDKYQSYIFGTDWPLIPVKPYINFIKKIIPEKYYEDVFYNNALRVFNKIKLEN